MNPVSPKLLLSGLCFTMATERKLEHWSFAFSISIKENTEAEGCSTHLPKVNRDIEWTSPAGSQVFQWVVTQYPSLSHCPFRVNTSFLIKSPKREVILNKHDPKVPQWPRDTATAPQVAAAVPGGALTMKSPFPPRYREDAQGIFQQLVLKGCEATFESLRIWLGFNQICMITSLVYSPRVMQTLIWIPELFGGLERRHCIVCPVSTDERWVFWLCRWVSQLLWFAVAVIPKRRQSPLRILGTSGLWWSRVGRALHYIQGFSWPWVCWGVPHHCTLGRVCLVCDNEEGCTVSQAMRRGKDLQEKAISITRWRPRRARQASLTATWAERRGRQGWD